MSYSGLVYTGEPQTGVAAASLKDKGNYAWAGAGSSDDVQVPWSIARADMGEASISRIAA